MAQLNGTFDASQVEPQAEYTPIPSGDYVVQIIQSEMRSTKSGAGQYLWLELEILEGEQAGRKLFERLNLINDNQQTMEIAQRQLSALCHAVNKMVVTDSEELHFIPFQAKVSVKQRKDDPTQYENRATYKPLSNTQAFGQVKQAMAPHASRPTPAAQPARQPASPPPAAARNFAKAPWHQNRA